MLKCAWCMKKIKEDKEVFTINIKFVEGKKISDSDGRMIHIHLESRNTSVPMIIPGENSEAKLEGIDGIFTICSQKCGEKMRASLAKEIAMFKDVTNATLR
jgi:hypothetical protein